MSTGISTIVLFYISLICGFYVLVCIFMFSIPETKGNVYEANGVSFSPQHMLRATWRESRNSTIYCTNGIHGKWVTRQTRVIRAVMWAIRTEVPFSWVRWGDGELLHSARNSKIEIDQRLRRSFVSLTGTENRNSNWTMINVGVWWLCNRRLRNLWDDLISSNNSDYIFMDSFYLPMGDPVEVDRTFWREAGVIGWVAEARRRRVVLIGPAHLKRVPVLKYAAHIETTGTESSSVARINFLIKKSVLISSQSNTTTLFVLAAGWASKIIIAELCYLLPRDSFIDVGSAFDGYAGVPSRDYNRDIKKYCIAVHGENSDPRDRLWMRIDTCRKYVLYAHQPPNSIS
eukprot:gene24313-29538_t